MKGYFVLASSGAERFNFNLKAGNHEVILTSLVYKSKEEALGGIDAVRRNASDPARFERKLAKDNSPYFVLLDESGKTIGRSEMYQASSAMENGIRSVMTNGPTTLVKGLDTAPTAPARPTPKCGDE